MLSMIVMAPGKGIEPLTRGLSGHRSTTELPRHWAAVELCGMLSGSSDGVRTRDLTRMKGLLYR